VSQVSAARESFFLFTCVNGPPTREPRKVIAPVHTGCQAFGKFLDFPSESLFRPSELAGGRRELKSWFEKRAETPANYFFPATVRAPIFFFYWPVLPIGHLFRPPVLEEDSPDSNATLWLFRRFSGSLFPSRGLLIWIMSIIVHSI